YYQMRYDTPDATALATRIAAMMPADEPVHQHASRGLDHGAWVPLKIMYPDADIPVLQMSLPTHDPVRLLAIGERLRPLRDEGVLIIGSGFLTHGLPFLTEWKIDAAVPGWSADFDAWAGEAMARGDVDELANYRTRAPGMPYAHPTVEHYTPLFVTLGAASTPDAPGIQVVDGFWMGLSKRSLQVA
ncbi:MAG: class III extradiol ring-cleavage dioxygenase, partial [Nocardioides sp.]